MKIGIYNQHIKAMGGGEKRTLAMAEYLSRDHTISLIVPYKLDTERLEHYFNVDLSRVEITVLNHSTVPRFQKRWFIEDAYFNQIKDLNLDLLINNSHESNLRCPARRGIYMCSSVVF